MNEPSTGPYYRTLLTPKLFFHVLKESKALMSIFAVIHFILQIEMLLLAWLTVSNVLNIGLRYL